MLKLGKRSKVDSFAPYHTANFHYSAYWGTWSFIVSSSEYGVVERNITPLNWRNSQVDWSEFGKQRQHCTVPDKGDVFADHLPMDVFLVVLEKVGKDRFLSVCSR